jgi:hypothetical protein
MTAASSVESAQKEGNMSLNKEQQVILNMAGKIFAGNAGSSYKPETAVDKAKQLIEEIRKLVGPEHGDPFVLGEVAATIFATISPKSSDASDVKNAATWAFELLKHI